MMQCGKHKKRAPFDPLCTIRNQARRISLLFRHVLYQTPKD